MTPTPSGASTPAHVKKEEVASEPEAKVDGMVGQLEIYKSGKVKMRIGKDIVLDVCMLQRSFPPVTDIIRRSPPEHSRHSSNTPYTSTQKQNVFVYWAICKDDS